MTPFALGGLLHAITSKFNAIYGFAHELLEDVPQEKHVQVRENLSQSLESFKAILEHLQFFAKHQMVQHEAFRMVELFGEIEKKLKKRLPGMRFDLNIKRGGDVSVYSDRALWENALLPIVQNACESYGDHTGLREVIIAVYQKDDKLSLIFQDKGQGIDPQTLPSIFTPFFTTKGAYRLVGSSPSRVQASGQVHHGLGLTLSSQIIDTLGGHFEVSSTPGKGTEIKLVFKENFIAS